jgi:hypothetical protein
MQAALPGVTFNFSQNIQDNIEEAISGVKGANSVKIIGPDLAVLEDLARQVMAQMSQVKGCRGFGRISRAWPAESQHQDRPGARRRATASTPAT